MNKSKTISPSKEQFEAYLEQGYQHIPLVREVLADLDTPLSTYLKLANGPYSYLFESVQGGEKWGRYSIIGLPASTLIKIFGNEVELSKDEKVISQTNGGTAICFHLIVSFSFVGK